MVNVDVLIGGFDTLEHVSEKTSRMALQLLTNLDGRSDMDFKYLLLVSSEMSVGFIFVEFSDPINQLARKVSKQRYSTIGIVSGDDIYIPKIYGDEDEIAKTCNTIQSLNSYPLTVSYALYEVNHDRRQDFLKVFVQHYKQYEKSPTASEMLDLFLGTGTFENTGVGIANSIIKKMGITLEKSNASSIDGYDGPLITEDKFDILSLFMSTFRSQIPDGEHTYLLCSHFTNPILKCVLEKTLQPNRDYRNAFVHRNSKFITNLLDTFVQKLSSNSVYNMSFSGAVLKSFNDVQEEQKRTKKLLLIALDKIVGASDSLSQTLFQGSTITWDKLISLTDNIKDGSDIISLLTQGKLIERKELEKPALGHDIHVTSGKNGSTSKICLESMRDIMISYESGQIKWGELINYANVLFSQHSIPQINLSEDTRPIKAKLIMDDSIDMSLELESGRVVQVGDDLKGLTYSELENLNNILDVLSKDDMKLDHIRSKVTGYLSKK